MATPKEVYELVKSLSINEKRHFRLQASLQNGKKEYEDLFDLFVKDEQEGYDEDFIIKTLSYKNKGSLKATINYLYDRLMVSLRSQNEDSVRSKINQFLLDVDVLKHRGFFQLALRELKKAEKLAKEHHKYAFLLTILEEQAVLLADLEERELLKDFQEVHHKIKDSQTIYQQEMLYRYRNGYLVQIFKQDRGLLDEELRLEVERIYNTTKAEEFPASGSFYAQYYYHSIQAIGARLLGELKEASFQQSEVVRIWESHQIIKKNNPQLYITQLANQINYDGWVGKLEDVKNSLVKLKELKVKGFDQEGEKWQNYYLWQQMYFMEIGAYSESQQLIPDIEKLLNKYKDKVNTSQLLSLCYNSAITLILLGNYKDAIEWFGRIASIPKKSEQLADIRQVARIWELVIYYNIDSPRVVESCFRSIDRKKALKASLKAGEREVFLLFKTLMNLSPDSRAAKKAFQQTAQKLEAVPTDQQRLFGFRELKTWIDIQCQDDNKDNWSNNFTTS